MRKLWSECGHGLTGVCVTVWMRQTPELFSYITHKLYALVEEDTAQLPLVHVAIWCIGEFGEVRLRVLCACSVPAFGCRACVPLSSAVHRCAAVRVSGLVMLVYGPVHAVQRACD